MLQGLEKAGLQLKPEKCEFNKTEVEYLGHVIHPSEKTVSAIREAPEPTNAKELKAFLGLLNYYRKFLANLSTTLRPLYVLQQKNRHWKWTQGHKKAFNKTKSARLSSGVLTHYDLEKPITL